VVAGNSKLFSQIRDVSKFNFYEICNDNLIAAAAFASIILMDDSAQNPSLENN